MAGHSTDDQLIEGLRSSNEQAFSQLFERYQPIVFRQVLFQTQDADLAHDVVQETFVRIWEHRRSARPGQSFLAYALRISSNIVRDMARHQAMRRRVADRIPPPVQSEGDDPAEALQLSLLEEKVAAIITHDLPARCRTVFLLSRFEGKSHREIAEVLGLSMKTVENQIHRALKILKKRLG